MRPQTKTPKLGGERAPRKYLSDHSSISQRLGESITIGSGAVVSIVSDGAIHRFDHPDKRRSNKRGWYVCHAEYGVWGDWATGEQHVIFAQGEHDPEIAHRARQEAEQRKRERRAEKERSNALAASQALQWWHQANPASADHHYLDSKKVRPYKLRQRGDVLLVPMFAGGVMVNLQRIWPDGTKRFLPGGRMTGAASLVGSLAGAETVYLGEGWSTAATIHDATGCPVVAAMNCGNLLPVARSLRNTLPAEVEIVIAADNDRRTEGNPGMTAAQKAAQEVSADLTWPRFPCEGCGCSDFNDLAACERQGVAA